jgi:hypothetical protein
MIVIYDDKTSNLNELQSESNPLKIVQENIKQCGYKKECKILKGIDLILIPPRDRINFFIRYWYQCVLTITPW